MRQAIWSLVIVALFSGASAQPSTNVSPCEPEGRALVQSWGSFSKPAGGNIDELPVPLDPQKPIKPQIKTIDDANLHADQCRAVLGPIPQINCFDGSIVPVYKDGKLITYIHGVLKVGGVPSPERARDNCDTPSLSPF